MSTEPGAALEDSATLRRLLDVVARLGAQRRSEPVLRAILEAARDLAAARYAAIGVPDGDGGFALFLTSGVDAATWDRIGALPRTHGLLGALLEETSAIRLADIRADPRFWGYPPAHPAMSSFLGVPIMAGGEIVAELYLANKIGAAVFGEDDQRVVETLAGHAALALVTAQHQERLRELSVVAERTRIARDLHDSVTQTMFSLSLAAETTATLAGASTDPRVSEQLGRVRELATQALDELHALVEVLRPPDLDRDGLVDALRKRVALLRAVHDVPVELDVRVIGSTGAGAGPGAGPVAAEVLKVANEAIANALRHAAPSLVRVELEVDGEAVRLRVSDDGTGFDLAETVRSTRRLGLVGMRERAAALGGSLRVDTAPGAGTTVVLEAGGG
ncbi:MAG: GAF domain-containing sensor histidine kinase [Pseudonocardia sp.]